MSARFSERVAEDVFGDTVVSTVVLPDMTVETAFKRHGGDWTVVHRSNAFPLRRNGLIAHEAVCSTIRALRAPVTADF